MDGEAVCTREAQIVEKRFAGGQLRIVFRLEDGQLITASRYGIDSDLAINSKVKIGWMPEHAVQVETERMEQTSEKANAVGELKAADAAPEQGGTL
jgi:spermidine/putrescine transport system ATP-binding protein